MSLAADQFNHADPPSILHLSQQAATLLARSASAVQSPLPSVLGSAETPETWTDLENLFRACLITGDDRSAHAALERLTQRFGAHNERVMGLRGLYQEAVARDHEEIRQVVEDYNKILSENPMNVPIHKRRITLVRALKQDHDAIAALVDFLESFPTDTEAWCELSERYHSQGLGAQAIYSLEEAVLNAPNAWNLHARLGELEFLASSAMNEHGESAQRLLVQSIRRFCRSIELCDDYLRGHYGLHLATAKLLASGAGGKSSAADQLPRDKVQRLHDLSIHKLQTLVQQWSAHQLPHIDQAEVIAVQELLDQTKP